MNEVNAKFYVLLDLDTMLFLHDLDYGYTSSVLEADRYSSEEEAEKALSECSDKDRIFVKEVQVIVCNMP